MVDDRRARIRRNMARAWAFAAAAHAQSIQNISWDLYGNPVGLGGGQISATLSTPAGGIPELVNTGSNIIMAASGGKHTTASISVGTASLNRKVILVGFNDTFTQNPLVAASIGGVAATIHNTGVGIVSGVGMTFIISADVPSGTVVGVSLSWSGGADSGGVNCSAFAIDKSTLSNPSPTVRSATGMTFSGSPLTATVTTSADACIVAVMCNRQFTHIAQTVSPSANFAYTRSFPTTYFGILYGNNVPAQASTIPYHVVTGSESAYIAVMAWR